MSQFGPSRHFAAAQQIWLPLASLSLAGEGVRPDHPIRRHRRLSRRYPISFVIDVKSNEFSAEKRLSSKRP
jgi:hypothetical protein